MKNVSGLLTALTVVGVGITGFFGIKAGERLKDEEKDLKDLNNLKKVAPTIGPVVIAGVATAGCAIASHKIDGKRIAAASALGIGTAATLKHYNAELKEFVGPAKYEEFKRKVGKKIEQNAPFAKLSEHPQQPKLIDGEPEIKFILHLNGEDVAFMSTWHRVLEAEANLNRLVAMDGQDGAPEATIGVFKDWVGIEPEAEDAWYGWDVESTYSFNEDCISWIDFEHTPINLENGETAWVIEAPTTPAIYLYSIGHLSRMSVRELEEAYQNGIISESEVETAKASRKC